MLLLPQLKHKFTFPTLQEGISFDLPQIDIKERSSERPFAPLLRD